jgi:hypothetical protein
MNDRHRLTIATTLVILTAFCLSGCSGSGQVEEGTPGAAVQNFYGHLGAGSYDAAQAMYSAEAREVVANPEMFRSWAEQATREGSIEKIVIVETKVAESQTDAWVDFEIAFKDGSSEANSVQLVDENGDWKLGLVVPK